MFSNTLKSIFRKNPVVSCYFINQIKFYKGSNGVKMRQDFIPTSITRQIGTGTTTNPDEDMYQSFSETIKVEIPNSSKALEIHPYWLRHHCQCQKCFNPVTFQKMTIPSRLPAISTISDIKVTPTLLKVKWKDNHVSSYDVKWLENNISNKYKPFVQDYSSFTHENIAQGSVDPFENAISYDSFMRTNDEGIGQLLQNIVKFGYGIVKDAPPDFESTKKVVLRISHPQNTIYGDFSSWTSDLAHADTAYTSDFVHLHTDTSYFSEPMGLQMFHCLHHDGTGGINSLVDGFRVAKRFQAKYPHLYNVLSQAIIPCQYLDPGKHHFYSLDVTLKRNILTGGIERIRYNPHDIAVINTISSEQTALFYESLVTFSNEIESNPMWLKLSPGIIIFIDNWRTLHGRSEFTGKRHLCGAYIGVSDWQSKARTLGIIS